MKKISKLAALFAAFAAPLLVVAQSGININAIKQPYSDKIIYFINYILVPVLMAVAFIVFLFGIYLYFIQGASNDESRSKGKQFALWGIIGFVIILSLWGIVNLFMGALGLSVGTAPAFPTIGTGSYVPAGNTGSTIFSSPPRSSTYGTPTQNAALLQQYNNMQTACNQNSTSPDCQAAQARYSASYYSVNPNPNATIQNAQNTTVGAGADCTYSPCASGLTCNYDSSLGYSICGSGGTSAQNTTVGAGADCTYSPCASGLTCNYDSSLGYSICGSGGASASSGGSTPTESPYQICMNTHQSTTVCDCQVNNICPI